MALRGLAGGIRRPSTLDGADALDASGQQAGQLVPTRPGEPGDADDLAGVHVEVERRQLGTAHGRDGQHRCAVGRRRIEPGVRGRFGDQLPAEHQVGQALVGELGRRRPW